MRDPDANIDPNRDACPGEGVNAFLEIAGRPTIDDEANVNAAVMVAD